MKLKLTIVKTTKLWVALYAPREATTKDIIDGLRKGEYNVEAFRNLSASADTWMWVGPDKMPLGRLAARYNSPANRVIDELSTGIASLLQSTVIEALKKPLKRPIREHLSRKPEGAIESPIIVEKENKIVNTNERRSCGSKSEGRPSIIEITIRGNTIEEIYNVMESLLEGHRSK